MTSPSELPLNGTSHAKIVDSKKTSSPFPSSSPTTPKAKLIPRNTNLNGSSVDNVNTGIDVNDTNQQSFEAISPQTSLPTITSSQTEMSSIESQNERSEQEEQNEDDAGTPGKRDLYVGNLYVFSFISLWHLINYLLGTPVYNRIC